MLANTIIPIKLVLGDETCGIGTPRQTQIVSESKVVPLRQQECLQVHQNMRNLIVLSLDDGCLLGRPSYKGQLKGQEDDLLHLINCMLFNFADIFDKLDQQQEMPTINRQYSHKS